MEQIVHTPVGRGVSGGLQGFPPRHGTLERTAEQIADIPVPGGLRHDSLPDPHPSALPADLPGELNQCFFFALSPEIKKSATVAARSRSRVPAHSSSSTPQAHDADFNIDDEENVWMQLDTGQWRMLNTGP